MKKVFGTLEYEHNGDQLEKEFYGIDEEEVVTEIMTFVEENLLVATKVMLKVEESTETRVGVFVNWKDDDFVEFIAKQDEDFARQVKLAREKAKEVAWHTVDDAEATEWLLRLGRYWCKYQAERQM